jgi:16S rRNA (adenine1518-N6/adenine1519-N6)-dimethyltransferase
MQKRYGQNFVVDPNLISKMIKLANVSKSESIIEVGAGLGALTLALANNANQVIAIENDQAIYQALNEVIKQYNCNNVALLNLDATKIRWQTFLSDYGFETRNYIVVSNLPYCIASTLVVDLLKNAYYVNRLVVMLQKEVAQRICAHPKDPAFGALSLKVALLAFARSLYEVSPNCFFPKPKVSSQIIEIIRRELWNKEKHELVFSLINRAFSQRRKMIKNTLPELEKFDLFDVVNISKNARPEELDINVWVNIAKELQRVAIKPNY